MNSTKTQMAVQILIPFGMPASGHAFVTTQGICGTPVATTSVLRDRKAALVITGVVGYAQGTFPGTPAWRPPTC